MILDAEAQAKGGGDEMKQPSMMDEPLIDVGRFRLFLYHEWGAVFAPRKYNWIDIHWLWLHTECSPYKDSVEWNLAVAGFCLSVDWYYGTREESC